MNSDPDEHLIVLSTVPDGDIAAELAGMVVESRLAACVNVIANVQSVYRWEGEICSDAEVLLVIKTTRRRLDDLVISLADAHPYECPEVVALPVQGGLDAYLDWVSASVASD